MKKRHIKKHSHPCQMAGLAKWWNKKKNMIIDENPNQKTKRFAFLIAFFLGVTAISALVIIGAQKIFWKQKMPETQPPVSAENPEKKQQDMIRAIEEANRDVEPLPPDEQLEKQKDMIQAIDEANKDIPLPSSSEEQYQKQKEMLDAINAANK